METFVAVALAHFMALLIPGVDFFLIARTAMTSGWRATTGTCLGIALANGMFILAAFSGLSAVSQPTLLHGIELAGGAFLVYVGVTFLRSRTHAPADVAPSPTRTTWRRNLGLGLASGLLNPKNALFYLSLAAAVHSASRMTLALYGLWMFSVVLAWDVFVAVALGSRRSLARMERVLPWLTAASGLVLVVIGVGMLMRAGAALVG
ncbi:LysE family translocator [Actinomycetota bacterium]